MPVVVSSINDIIKRALKSPMFALMHLKQHSVAAVSCSRRSPLLLILPLLAAPLTFAEIPPDSGDMLQQQTVPAEPLNRAKNTLFELLPLKKGGNTRPFYVADIDVIGNVKVTDAALAEIVAPYQHKEVTLNDLQALCYAITAHYRQQGYLFSRAFVPQQRLKQGMLTLQVIEARLGDISLDNQSLASSDLLTAILAQIPTGEVIEKKRINRALLLLQDVPGIAVNTAIGSGKSLGLSDLRIVVKDKTPQHQLSINNYASRYVDRLQVSGRLNYANLLGHGDELNLSLVTSGDDLLQGSLHYALRLGDNSDKLGFNLNHLDYTLGGDLKALNPQGQAATINAYWQHNWLRSLDANVYSQWQVQHQTLHDSLNDGAHKTNRSTDTLSLSVSGDLRNALFEQSVSSADLSVTVGDLSFANSAAQVRDSLSAKSAGAFSKINLSLQHRQALTPALEISVRLSVQQAQNNLDSSQKKNITGPYGVRAYDGGGVSADSGWLANIELQHRFSSSAYGDFSLYGFVDAAKVKINQKSWSSASDENRISLAGVGLGVRWQSKTIQANAFVATPIGNTPALLSEAKKGVLWMQLSKHF